jgi:hypothetical protein
MPCTRSYPFPRLPRISFQRCKLTYVRASLRFANLTPTFSYRARPKCRRFASRLGHGALALFASNPPTMGRMGELHYKFPEHYDAIFRVAVCRIFGLPSSRILSILRSLIACASCHLWVQAMRGSAGVNMSDDAWLHAFDGHLSRCGGDASVQTAHSWFVAAHAEIISEARDALGDWRRGSHGHTDVSSTPQRQRRPPCECGCLALPRHPTLKIRS